jgi:hypothetical protein
MAAMREYRDKERIQMSRFMGVLVLGISLLAPVSLVNAQDHDHDQGPDSAHPMEHQWSDHEEKPWHEYEKAHHRKDHDWAKASKTEQSHYWKWRDQHPD